MPKLQKRYVCRHCNAPQVQYYGFCPACRAEDELIEEIIAASEVSMRRAGASAAAVPITQIPAADADRLPTGIMEFDRVLGGGAVPGSLVLLAGDPGIGKSTLLLQAANALARRVGPVLYASGEESLQQIRMRSQRLADLCDDLLVAAACEISDVEAHLEQYQPKAVVVDSIQSAYQPELDSAPGTVTQVRECAGRVMRIAKETGVAAFLVGHVTKEGAVAGPKLLEHMVDTVLYLEGDHQLGYRLLRAVKNRFGSTNELGIFEMTDHGMTEVGNPSQVFLTEHRPGTAGTAVIPVMEGTRPLLVEVQALVSPAAPFGAPRRAASGVDRGRLSVILAVLEKRAALPLGNQDVYINVPGGVRIAEPAADLGIALAIASSSSDRALASGLACCGEVGLTGEIRPVSHLDRRVAEAARLGFERCLVATAAVHKLRREAAGATGVEDLAEALQAAIWQDAPESDPRRRSGTHRQRAE